MTGKASLLKILGCAFIVAQLSACASLSTPATSELDQFELPYLTTRAFEFDDNGRTRYSTAVAETSAGACTLTQVPAAKPRVDSYRSLPLEDALASLDEGREDGLLVYIHGYNTGLKRACREAAILAARTGFDGRLLLFSWPASSTVFTYRKDARRLAASMPAIRSSLDRLSEEFRAGDISVIAHSMGSVAVASELQSSPVRNVPLGDLILIAPDIDLDTFAESLPTLKERFRDISVLVSETDRMLLLSEIVNSGSRLGRTTDVEAPGVRVIDVSDLGDLGFGNHLYHLNSDEVAEELRGILAD